MKPVLFYLILFFWCISCQNEKKTAPPKPLTGNIQTDLKILLPDGTVKAEIMDSLNVNARQNELMEKITAAIKKNQDWYIEYVQTNPEDKPMPYHPNLGLTKEEYAELSAMKEYGEMVSSGTEEINISVADSVIRFKSKNKLAGLDSLMIDLKNNIVRYGAMKLPFNDTISFTDEMNAMKSKWKGYSWKLRQLTNLTNNNPKGRDNLGLLNYELMIGRLEKNGKTFMMLKGGELNGSVKKMGVDMPVMF